MTIAILGKKIGMTRLYDENGASCPATVLQCGPCQVSQIKTADHDGYDAIQLAYEDVRARNSTMPVIGHDAKAGIDPKRHHREFRVEAGELENYQLGQTVSVEAIEGHMFVDVIATSKGKGFQGPMVRWGFKGFTATHGTERKHRAPGSVGSRASNAGTGRPKKGGKKAGQTGNKQVTMRSLKVLRIDKANNLLIVKGAVPGPNQGLVYVRESIRLSKAKGKLVASAS